MHNLVSICNFLLHPKRAMLKHRTMGDSACVLYNRISAFMLRKLGVDENRTCNLYVGGLYFCGRDLSIMRSDESSYEHSDGLLLAVLTLAATKLGEGGDTTTPIYVIGTQELFGCPARVCETAVA